jgi:hypothetical protein
LYMKNYDQIVRTVSRTDARRAHKVAAQAFRTNNPMRWAKRYLAELQDAGWLKDRHRADGQPSLLTKHEERVDVRGSARRHVRSKQR